MFADDDQVQGTPDSGASNDSDLPAPNLNIHTSSLDPSALETRIKQLNEGSDDQ